MHPLAGRHLEQVEDRVALAQRVPEHRHRAEVERRGPEPEQVRVQPVELEVDRPQVRGARRDLELEQLLDRAAEGLHVEEVGEVVHPLDERDHLPVALVLAGLLDPGVDVADDRLEVDHLLALEADQQAQHPVRGGVVRAQVDGQQLVLGLEQLAGLGALDRRGADDRRRGLGEQVAAGGRGAAASLDAVAAVRRSLRSTRDLVLVVGEDHRLAADREVAALRPADVDLRQQDPAQVRVAAEDDPEEVVDLALVELGGREQIDAGIDVGAPPLRVRGAGSPRQRGPPAPPAPGFAPRGRG